MWNIRSLAGSEACRLAASDKPRSRQAIEYSTSARHTDTVNVSEIVTKGLLFRTGVGDARKIDIGLESEVSYCSPWIVSPKRSTHTITATATMQQMRIGLKPAAVGMSSHEPLLAVSHSYRTITRRVEALRGRIPG